MKTLLLAILLLPGSLYLGAQERHAQVKQLADNYCSVAGNYVSLYSGKEQLKYMTGVTGHPYWVDDSYAPASLYYDGICYKNVLLRLDIYRDELIIISPDVRFHVILVGDYLGWADFHGSRVIYHIKNSLPGSPSTGYYIQLYSGEHTVLEKQNKYFYSQVLDRRVEHLFSDKKSTYYLLKEGQYYTVNSKGALLKQFRSHKKELDSFARRHKLNFKKDPVAFITAIVEHYEELTR